MDGGAPWSTLPHVILHFLPNKGQRISDFPHPCSTLLISGDIYPEKVDTYCEGVKRGLPPG